MQTRTPTYMCGWGMSHHFANQKHPSFPSLPTQVSALTQMRQNCIIVQRLLCSLNQYFLSTHYMQGLMPGTGGRHKWGLSPASQGHHTQGRGGPWAMGHSRHCCQEPGCVCVCVCVCAHMRTWAQSHSTLCDLMNCSLPGSSVQGISQAWILEWVAISFSK